MGAFFFTTLPFLLLSHHKQKPQSPFQNLFGWQTHIYQPILWVGCGVCVCGGGCFLFKLAGASYMEIHQAGGGIHFTVEHTGRATEEELFSTFRQRLERMQRAGSTLVECKSGYGLKWEAELKMLRVIERARRSMDVGISSTYCGAHSVPK